MHNELKSALEMFPKRVDLKVLAAVQNAINFLILCNELTVILRKEAAGMLGKEAAA